MPLSRRTFCSAASLLAVSRLMGAQGERSQEPTSRPDVGAIDHERILTAADRYRSQPVETFVPPSASHPNARQGDFVTELEVAVPGGATVAPDATRPFTAHRDAMLRLTLAVPALAAGWLITRTSDSARAAAYAQRAAEHLRAWFVTPATRMTPTLEFAASSPGTGGHPEGVVETSALAEVAVAVAFLVKAEAFSADELTVIRSWFADLLKWLMTSRLAGLARDRKDHVASSWLLQSSAYARLCEDDAALAVLRHQFKTATLRAEVVADGTFPHELTTSAPYRNSLFNLDLLAGACDQLSTRFENLWDFQLQDGPGMRVAVARHFPYIENRGAWPYRSDPRSFQQLPGRRPALLFAARAYQRPEYATLWRTLPADPQDPVILRSFPILQPVLWVTRVPV